MDSKDFFQELHGIFFLLVINKCLTCEGALRIIGGRDALREEFPYAVSLEQMTISDSDEDHRIEYWRFCTGAALTSEWIISAAHCYSPSDYVNPNIKTVIRYNSYFPKYLGQLSPVLEVFLCPRLSQFDLKREHDVALFRSQNISVSQYAKISAVYYKSILGHEVNILGFGGTNASDTDKPLQVLKGMINRCLVYENSGASNFCVVRPCELEATICGGDSGGPVVHPSGIVGVNSRSVDDCDEFTTSLHLTPGTSASIVAMVSDITDWLLNVILNNIQEKTIIKNNH